MKLVARGFFDSFNLFSHILLLICLLCKRKMLCSQAVRNEFIHAFRR